LAFRRIKAASIATPARPIKWTNKTFRFASTGCRNGLTAIALGFFILIAILGPLVGADSRVPGGIDLDLAQVHR